MQQPVQAAIPAGYGGPVTRAMTKQSLPGGVHNPICLLGEEVAELASIVHDSGDDQGELVL